MAEPVSETAFVWGAAVAGLRLGLAASGGTVWLALQNVIEAPIEVFSHVEAGEIHLDWYRIQLTNAAGEARTLRIQDDRDESWVVRATIQPGERIQHRVVLASWATRPMNRELPLAPGTYEATAIYQVSATQVWSGKIEAGPVTITLP
jgi:hypothetical protein